MVITIVASLGELTAKLNAVFTPQPLKSDSSQSFDSTLNRLAEGAAGLALSGSTNVQYRYSWVPATVRENLMPLDAYKPGQYRYQLSGFSHDKIGPNHASSMNKKYIAARVFEQIDVHHPEALNMAVAVLKAQGWDATIVGKDKIDFNDGLGPVDVIRNMSTQTNMVWHWMVDAAPPEISSLDAVEAPVAVRETLAPPDLFVVVQQVAAETGYPDSRINVTAFTQIVAERLAQKDANCGRYVNSNGNLGKDTLAYRINGQNDHPYKIDIVSGSTGPNPRIHWSEHGESNGTWTPAK